MNRKKRIKYIVSLILAITITLTSVNITSFAKGIIDTKTAGNEIAEKKEDERKPSVVSELIEKRTEKEKHFLMSDGSVTAAVYNEPIHYKEATTIDNEVSTNTVVDTSKTPLPKSDWKDVDTEDMAEIDREDVIVSYEAKDKEI